MADKTIFANQGATKPNVPKSLFDLSHGNNMTAKFGKLYPVWCYDAPAGSSFHIKPRFGFDLMPMNFPIQSNVRAHLKFYKIPKRILWEDYKDFVGQHGDHKIPHVQRTDYFHKQGSLADYLNIPSNKIVESYVFRNYRSYGNVVYLNAANGQTSASSRDGFLRFGLPFTIDAKLVQSVSTTAPTFSLDLYTDTELTSSFISDSIYFVYPDVSGSLSVVTLPYAASIAASRWSFAIQNESVLIGGVSLYHHRIVFNIGSTAVASFNSLFDSGSSRVNVVIGWTNSGFGTPTNWRLAEPINSVFQGIEDSKDDPPVPLYSKEKVVMTRGIAPNISVYVTEFISSQNTSPLVAASAAADPALPISVLPFRAYEFIYNYFFLNERVTPFRVNGVETYNKFITNASSGADSTTPLDLRDVPYEFDMFTTCLKTPMFGNAPLVGITTNDLDNEGVFHMVPDGEDPYDIAVTISPNDDKRIIGISNYDDVADRPSVHRLSEAIDFGISINDFRNVNCLTRFQERHLKAGTKYQNIVYEFFGTNPPIGEEFPEYIGGVTDDIIVSKITNTAKSDGYELGEFAGQGVFRSKGKKIKTFCSEESYIMGVIYFTVTPTYPQELPRHFTKTDLLDFYNPQFAMIGPQPVYKHELCPLQLADANLYDVFGYNAPFSDYKSCRDEVHGDFRGSLANYLIQRRFATPPSLNSQFLYIDSEDLTDVFSVQDNTDKIFGQIWFDIKAKLPMPRYSVPRII